MAGPDESRVASLRRHHCRLVATVARLATMATLGSLPVAAITVLSAGPVSAAPTTSSPASTATTATTTPRTGSSSSKFSTPDQWVLGAIAAEESLGSVRVDGEVAQDKSKILLDLLVNGDGEGGGVFVQEGDLIKIERVGTLLYLDAPKKFWAAHATAEQTRIYGGKWLALNAADKRFASFDQFLDPTALVVAAFQGHTAPLTMGKATKFAGHKVVVVTDTSTSDGKATTETMYIGSASPHYVYKIVDDTPTEVGTIVFSHYGKAVALTVPPEPLNLTDSS